MKAGEVIETPKGQQPAEVAEVVASDSGDNKFRQLMVAAVQHGAEAIKGVYEIMEKERADERKVRFHAALSAAQAKFPDIPKNRKADFSGSKGRVTYKYADLASVLAACRPMLNQAGISIRTYSGVAEKGFYRAVCELSGFGHIEKTFFDVPNDSMTLTAANSAQKAGAARTYAARYAVYDALGIFPSDEDTDANDVASATPKAQESPPQPAPQKISDDIVELLVKLKALSLHFNLLSEEGQRFCTGIVADYDTNGRNMQNFPKLKMFLENAISKLEEKKDDIPF